MNSAFSENISKTQKKFLLDFTIYNMTGYSDSNFDKKFKNLPKDFYKNLSRIKWNLSNGPSTVFDLLFPDDEGLYESVLAAKNEISAEKVQEFIENFNFSDLNFKNEKLSDFENEIDSEILEKIEKKSIQNEEIFKSINKELALYKFEDEIFSVQKKSDSRIITTSYGDKSVRNFLDDKNRILKKEIWKIQDLNTSEIEKTEKFKYSEDKLTPFEAEFIEKDKKTHIFYDENGKTVETKIYFSLEKLKADYGIKADESDSEKSENIKNQEQKYLITEENFYFYDEKLNLIEKKSNLFEYKNLKNNFNSSKKEISEKFKYKNEKVQPDYYFYENKILKYSKEFSTNEDYIFRAYFEDGIVVESYYNNGIKQKDLFYQNQILFRRKNYENIE